MPEFIRKMGYSGTAWQYVCYTLHYLVLFSTVCLKKAGLLQLISQLLNIHLLFLVQIYVYNLMFLNWLSISCVVSITTTAT